MCWIETNHRKDMIHIHKLFCVFVIQFDDRDTNKIRKTMLSKQNF